jgi:hypothetical protein
MRTIRAFALSLIAAGCASGGRFPQQTGDPRAEIATAERLVGAAQQAGADSLAPQALALARQQLAAAQADVIANENDRAAFKARLAAADATYARAAAERAKAERARASAQAALQQSPPQGSTP